MSLTHNICVRPGGVSTTHSYRFIIFSEIDAGICILHIYIHNGVSDHNTSNQQEQNH